MAGARIRSATGSTAFRLVLRHEHQVQRVEHRPGDVPVEVVRRSRACGVGEQLRQAADDGGTSASSMPMLMRAVVAMASVVKTEWKATPIAGVRRIAFP
jgi:hypothetical protein